MWSLGKVFNDIYTVEAIFSKHSIENFVDVLAEIELLSHRAVSTIGNVERKYPEKSPPLSNGTVTSIKDHEAVAGECLYLKLSLELSNRQ
jgi:hypothetical protein